MLIKIMKIVKNFVKIPSSALNHLESRFKISKLDIWGGVKHEKISPNKVHQVV